MLAGRMWLWKGDRQAKLSEKELHALYLKLNRPIYAFFLSRGFDPEDCRELTQETFLEAHRSAGSFYGKSSPETWLFGIAKMVWRETVRNRRRKKRSADLVSLDSLSESGDRPAADSKAGGEAAGQGALEKLLGQERELLLRRAIAGLPERMRLCAILHAQGREPWQIAEILQIKPSAVRSHLSQARKRLKAQLADDFADVF